MFGVRDVEVVREIVRRGGFRPAALALGLSQSAVSTRVMLLEERLGVPLFDRSRRRAALTPEGRRFLEEAERLVLLRDRIAGRYRDGGAGTLRLGVAETVVHTRMAALARALKAAAPGLRIELAVDSSPALARMLVEDRVDVAVPLTPFVPPGATSVPFGRFELGWYAAPTLALPEPANAEALVAQPIVTFARDTLPWREVERLLARPELDPPLLHGSASLATVLGMVADGAGVGTLPREMAHEAVRAGRVREVTVTDDLALSPLLFSIAWMRPPPGGITDALGDLSAV